MRNQNYAIRTVYLAIVIIALFATASVALAQEGAAVYLQPIDSPEGTLTVDVMADNVTDMYGAEFELKYDPVMLAVQDAEPNKDGIQIEAGTLLPANKGFIVANKADNAEGTVIFAMTLLNPAPSVTGGGPLARVTFNVLNAGPSTIEVARAKLVALDLQTIPSSITPLAIGGQNETAPQPQAQQAAPAQSEGQSGAEDTTLVPINTEMEAAPQSNDFPWWIVAAAVLILGVLGLGAFVLMMGMAGSKKNNASESVQSRQQPVTRGQTQSQIHPPAPAQPRQQPAAGGATRTRPSAFK